MMLSAYNRHHDPSLSDEPPIAMAPTEALLLSLSTSPSLAQQEHQRQQQQQLQRMLSSEVVDGSSGSGNSFTVSHTDRQSAKQQRHDCAYPNAAAVVGRDRVLDPLKIRVVMPSNHGGAGGSSGTSSIGKSTVAASARRECLISSPLSVKGDEVSLLGRQSQGRSSFSTRATGMMAAGGGLPRHERESRASARIVSTGRITVASGLLLQSSSHSAASSSSSTSAAANGKRFRCDYCPFSCSWRYDLKLHLKQKHGIHKKNV
uniref:C2H2-type domain-containing protein n=1 Tax=Anopheles maculatus TaxID=74869 RepID=A0A182SW71_9DIPT